MKRIPKAMKALASDSASARDPILSIYNSVRDGINSATASRGFVLSEDIYTPKPFGCRDALFTRGRSAIRLRWDGKLGRFFLTYSDDANVPPPHGRWRIIAVSHRNPRVAPLPSEEEVVAGLNSALASFLASLPDSHPAGGP